MIGRSAAGIFLAAGVVARLGSVYSVTRDFIFLLMKSLCLRLIVSALCLGSARAAASPPNIIFVLADDYGTGEVGCYGADHYATPQIDALARSGTRTRGALWAMPWSACRRPFQRQSECFSPCKAARSRP